MLKNILITGVGGFIASHLAEELLLQGHNVLGIDNMITGQKGNITNLQSYARFRFLEQDVCSLKDDTTNILLPIDEIYHLASPASPKAYLEHPLETITANIDGTRTMLELARTHQAKMVFTSTSEAYGDPLVHPQPETYRGNVNTWGPRACYDESKRMGEVLCYLYHKMYNTKVKVSRIFNTYSSGLANGDGRVISNFLSQAMNGNEITVYGDGMQTRSFCYVTDTISGLLKMMETEKANGEIINIGNDTEYTILEVANIIKRLTSSDSPITFHPLPEDDPQLRRPDLQKAFAILDWKPTVSLEEGIMITIRDLQRKNAKET